MSIKLTTQSFLNGLQHSGLVAPERWDALMEDLHTSDLNMDDSPSIAAWLVERNIVTQWQADQLLQGRNKGFILGRYKLLSLLGAGEMSAVFKAEHLVMERFAAIKVLPGNRVKDTSYLGRFYREARAVAALDHPNIIRAYDVDRQDGGGTDIHFLVMEYVPGKTIDQLVNEQGPMDVVAAADLFRQAAKGLAHAHAAGLVHRDVKPANLLVDDHGTLKMLDLGLARFFRATEEESLTLKHDERVLGTADYLAPEQAIDSHTVDSRADIYALGCSFFFALTGHPPYIEGTLVQRLLSHQTKPIPNICHERPEVPVSLHVILARMMAKKAEDRYQTAEEVDEALSNWIINEAGEEWAERKRDVMASLKLAAVHQPASRSGDQIAESIAGTGTSTQLSSLTVREFGRQPAELPAMVEPEIQVPQTLSANWEPREQEAQPADPIAEVPSWQPVGNGEYPVPDVLESNDRRLYVALAAAILLIAVISIVALW